MNSSIEVSASAINRGLRHLVAALGGRIEFASRFERPAEAREEDYSLKRLRENRERAARKDFERAHIGP